MGSWYVTHSQIIHIFPQSFNTKQREYKKNTIGNTIGVYKRLFLTHMYYICPWKFMNDRNSESSLISMWTSALFMDPAGENKIHPNVIMMNKKV